MPLSAGDKLGPYEILAPIGAGGMGEVYRARDTRLGREVALKVLPPSFAADEGLLRRFTQEAQSAGALNHPNILAIHDIGTHEGLPYMVSELLEGDGTETAVLATNPGVVLGTAPYMSPEQVRGEPVDQRSDIFSFGCVLY